MPYSVISANNVNSIYIKLSKLYYQKNKLCNVLIELKNPYNCICTLEHSHYDIQKLAGIAHNLFFKKENIVSVSSSVHIIEPECALNSLNAGYCNSVFIYDRYNFLDFVLDIFIHSILHLCSVSEAHVPGTVSFFISIINSPDNEYLRLLNMSNCSADSLDKAPVILLPYDDEFRTDIRDNTQKSKLTKWMLEKIMLNR